MDDRFVSAACRGLAALLPAGRVLLAVSGGADSVALLDALWSGRDRRDLKPLPLVVGHFDHRLRPDSARDCELVGRLATERGLPFAYRVADPDRPVAGGLEEAAREARYAALEEMAVEHDCAAVATAHTATDQAETLLWHLSRGSGARGLGAMRADRPLGPLRLLRPLLGVERAETRSYCQRRRLTFHDDPTNAGERPRASLRAEVLPVLERLAPGAARHLAAAADRFREDDDWLEALAAQRAPADWSAPALAALPTPLRRRALAQWAASHMGGRRRLSSAHIHALESLVASGAGEVELPAGPEARRVALLRDGRLALEQRPR